MVEIARQLKIDKKWAGERVDNIYKIIERVKNNDKALFYEISHALNELSTTMQNVGDYAYSNLLSTMANIMYTRALSLNTKKAKKNERNTVSRRNNR